MQQVVEVTHLPTLPEEGDLLEPKIGLNRDFGDKGLIDLLHSILRLEGEVMSLIFAHDYFKTDIHELEPPFVESLDLIYGDLLARFGCHLVEGLEVNGFVGEVHYALGLNEWHNFPDMQFALDEGLFAD